MLDEKDNSASCNSISDFELKIPYPKLIFTPLICSSPVNMAKYLTNNLGINHNNNNNDILKAIPLMNHTLPRVRPLAEIPETIIAQLDITEWSMENSSFKYFTLPDLQMPSQENDNNNNNNNNMAKFKQINFKETMSEANIFAIFHGFGLFQRIMGMSNGIWNSRPRFIEIKRKRTRTAEQPIPYIERKIFLPSISKTFRQAFPSSLLDVLCNLEISVDTTQTSEENSSYSIANSDSFIEDSQNAESNDDIFDNSIESIDNDSHSTFVHNQLFKHDPRKKNPLLDIDEKEEGNSKIYINKQSADHGALSYGANVEPRIADNKDKQQVIIDINKSLEIADPIDIQNSGIQIFNENMELFYVENFKNWKRYGEGEIQIWQTVGPVLSYYILLWDNFSNDLLIHIKLSVDWRIEYVDKSSDTCHWMNYNYASLPKGRLERLSYRFPDSDTAAQFVMFVDKCVDKLLLV